MSTKFNSLLLLLFAGALIFTSCGDDDETTIDDISGTYVGTKIELRNCTDPEENLNESGNTTDGICITEDGTEACILIELTFNNGTYTSVYTIEGGGLIFTSTDMGTYDPSIGADELCIDGDCGTIDIQNGGDKIVFSGQDDDGCDVTFELERR